MRLRLMLVGVVCGLVCLGASALAAGSSMPKGGPVDLIVQPGNNQGAGKIIFTGAIGDYGTSSPTKTKSGQKYGVATLTKGTLHVDLTAITKKVNSANPPFDSATCSARGVGDRARGYIRREGGLQGCERQRDAHRDVRVRLSSLCQG